ncbi:hypothetical protein JAAARDRAFT_198720 [Jaapia argillacea MUCL 33604]|uniref:Uncharacterized protein n=1 Tax=Jaapia argillacea MUCL 33604 TaxID=933084 RepID=A0A067PAP2_9AGAM|nr:hypothetical protein JAAARDRAFT_198720 [Jaapia argillacea MUCL 33604]
MVGTLHDNSYIKQVPSCYTPLQVAQWLNRISYPSETTVTETEISSGTFPINFETLTILVRLHLVAFPYENTAMHYTPDHDMDVTPEGVFERLVSEHKGKGSYCFGLNTLLLGMLRGLGYRAYASVARVNKSPPHLKDPNYQPMSHMILFIQPIVNSNQTYVVNVGFGGSGLARPILLSDAADNIVQGTAPPEEHRLTRGPHPDSSRERPHSGPTCSLDWRLEIRNGMKFPNWHILFAFGEAEFYQPDFESLSFSVAKRPGPGILWQNVICIKHVWVPSEDGGRKEDGCLGRDIMFGGKVKREIGDEEEVIIDNLKDETERVQVLRETFGVQLEDGAERHIKGRDAALKSKK